MDVASLSPQNRHRSNGNARRSPTGSASRPGRITDTHQKICDVAVDRRPYLGPLKIDLGLRKPGLGARKRGFCHLRISVEHLFLLNRGGQRCKSRPPGVLRFLDFEIGLSFRIVALALTTATSKSNFSMT